MESLWVGDLAVDFPLVVVEVDSLWVGDLAAVSQLEEETLLVLEAGMPEGSVLEVAMGMELEVAAEAEVSSQPMEEAEVQVEVETDFQLVEDLSPVELSLALEMEPQLAFQVNTLKPISPDSYPEVVKAKKVLQPLILSELSTKLLKIWSPQPDLLTVFSFVSPQVENLIDLSSVLTLLPF